VTADTRRADFVVVGAGLAGLAAAARLFAAGGSLVVVEARSRLGGRVETVHHEGYALDLGGSWIGADHVRARTLVRELGLDTWPCHSEGATVVRDDGSRLHDRRYSVLHPLATVDYRLASRRLDRMAQRVSPEAPWAAAAATELDSGSLEDWLRSSTRTERSRTTLRRTAANIFSAEPSEVSLLHALFYIRSSGGLGPMLATAGGAQELLVRGGAEQLASGMARGLEGSLELGAPVRRIVQGASGVRVETGSLTVDAAAAVVAVPPVTTARIEFQPELPVDRTEMLRAMSPGDAVRMADVYDTAFWRDDGLSGEAWGPNLPFSFTHDVSSPGGAPGVMATFFVGERARRIRELPPERRREVALTALAECFGDRAAHPRAHVERDWGSEEWTRGGYCASMTPGLWSRHGGALRDPVGRLAWAGTETATEHAGYMEGALQSGERAASEVLALA
jgi:monoamine oxidase